MDLDFFRRSGFAIGERSPAALDFGVLVATLRAVQSVSPAARAQAHCAAPSSAGAHANTALVELLTGGPGWQNAPAAQCGAFNPAYASWARKPS